jgi:chloramphenicol 3-O-phosphotransferase
MAGRALVITGTTGSGKTTTCGQFVADAEELWFHFGVDLFMGKVVPRKYVDGGPLDHEGLHMEPDDPAQPEGARHMVLGPSGKEMIQTFHVMAAQAVRAGARLVIDHVTTFDPPILADLLDHFRGLDVFFVCLRPPADIVPQRIDSRLGSIVAALGEEHGRRANENTKLVSRYMSAQINAHDVFDLIVDTGAHNPAEAARLIREALARRRGTAFAELTRRLDERAAPFAGACRAL